MLELNQAKQLKEFQRENTRLKRMLADEMLGKELLKEVFHFPSASSSFLVLPPCLRRRSVVCGNRCQVRNY